MPLHSEGSRVKLFRHFPDGPDTVPVEMIPGDFVLPRRAQFGFVRRGMFQMLYAENEIAGAAQSDGRGKMGRKDMHPRSGGGEQETARLPYVEVALGSPPGSSRLVTSSVKGAAR